MCVSVCINIRAICTCLTAVILIYLNVIHKMIRGFMQIPLQMIFYYLKFRASFVNKNGIRLLKDTLIEDGMKNRNGKKTLHLQIKCYFWFLLISIIYT